MIGVTIGGVTIVVVPPAIVVFIGVIIGVVITVPGTEVADVDVDVEIPGVTVLEVLGMTVVVAVV